jgi:uncharacterized protein YkwD
MNPCLDRAALSFALAWLFGRSLQAATPVSVDSRDRAAMVQLYQTVYKSSQDVAMGWDGNVTDCLPGDTSQAYKDATLLRVNYFRAMAGLPGDVTLNEDLNRKSQEAALIMSAENELSHTPPSDWPCYTADGVDAASRCNLSLGSAGPEAVQDYMDDPGASNTAVGHRRWVLYPPQGQMGTGSIPALLDSATGEILHDSANALWVISQASPRPAGPEYVAWPPTGFVPYPILPNRSGRWSLSYASANFSGAAVVMQCSGTNVAVTLEALHNGYGDNALVWRPKLSGGARAGSTYSVTVSNIFVSGQTRVVSYSVSVIDPDELRMTATRLPDSQLLLSWPATSQASTLQETGSLLSGADWVQLSATHQLTNGVYSVTVPIDGQQRFYRLR